MEGAGTRIPDPTRELCAWTREEGRSRPKEQKEPELWVEIRNGYTSFLDLCPPVVATTLFSGKQSRDRIMAPWNLEADNDLEAICSTRLVGKERQTRRFQRAPRSMQRISRELERKRKFF